MADIYGTLLTRLVWIVISRDADLEDGDFLSVAPTPVSNLESGGMHSAGGNEDESTRLIATSAEPSLLAPRGFGPLMMPKTFKEAWAEFENAHIERLPGTRASVEEICNALENFEVIAAARSGTQKAKVFAYSLLRREHLLVEVAFCDEFTRVTFKWKFVESDTHMLDAIASVNLKLLTQVKSKK